MSQNVDLLPARLVVKCAAMTLRTSRLPRPRASRIINGEELESPSRARTLRRRHPNRPPAATDGPFMETKEILGGYYLLEAANLDEVEALVALLPEVQADHSGVEIRPVVDHG